MAPGRFLSLEGGEGAGKSTQARALAGALGMRGIDALVTREPGGSAGAEAIRGLLMQGAGDRWGARAEALLFAAARADHVDRVIRPALDAGRWVICDRFVDSTRAYQGGAGGLDDDALLALHDFAAAGLMPDRTYWLDLPPRDGAARADGRDGADADRFAARADPFHEAVARAFAGYAAREPARFRRIDARPAPARVTAAIIDDLADWLS